MIEPEVYELAVEIAMDKIASANKKHKFSTTEIIFKGPLMEKDPDRAAALARKQILPSAAAGALGAGAGLRLAGGKGIKAGRYGKYMGLGALGGLAGSGLIAAGMKRRAANLRKNK